MHRLSTYPKAKSEDNNKNDLQLCSNDLSNLFPKYIIDQQCNDPHIQAAAEIIMSLHDTNTNSVFFKTFRYFLRIERYSWPLCSVVVVDWSWTLINSVMNEWNHMIVSEYLQEVYVTLNKKEKLRSDLMIIVDKFMTILLTQSLKEANSSIPDMNKFNTSKYEFENENFNLECETNYMGDDNKLEGRMFIDSLFFKRYLFKMCEVQKSVANIDIIDNKYYAPEIADYITNHYMPFALMWSALLLKQVAPSVISSSISVLRVGVNFPPVTIPMRRNKRNITQCNEQNENDPLIEETCSVVQDVVNQDVDQKHEFETSAPISHEKSNANNISKLNLSKSSTHANALDNGLFFDVEYYMNSPDPLLTIGIYRSITNAPVTKNYNYTLTAEEFCTLKNTGDSYEKLKDSHWRVYNITTPVGEKILMPYLYSSHWYLLIVNIDENTISHLDPKTMRSHDSHRAIRAFKKYLEKASLRDKASKDICDRECFVESGDDDTDNDHGERVVEIMNEC
ncbi:hypothetical protein PV325_005095 [Microctonus aethiopoides]|nr:hypothetical protein PV325_005095 [Microctonus aethiopoides]